MRSDIQLILETVKIRRWKLIDIKLKILWESKLERCWYKTNGIWCYRVRLAYYQRYKRILLMSWDDKEPEENWMPDDLIAYVRNHVAHQLQLSLASQIKQLQVTAFETISFLQSYQVKIVWSYFDLIIRYPISIYSNNYKPQKLLHIAISQKLNLQHLTLLDWSTDTFFSLYHYHYSKGICPRKLYILDANDLNTSLSWHIHTQNKASFENTNIRKGERFSLSTAHLPCKNIVFISQKKHLHSIMMIYKIIDGELTATFFTLIPGCINVVLKVLT